MPSNLLNILLSQAIREKRRVFATYEGHPREFCPHALGYKDGIEHVLAYQFGGSSRKGLVEGEWKCFIVANLLGIALTNGNWRTDPGESSSREQHCLDNSIEQVS